MGIDWLRDLIICVSGVVVTVVFIFIAVLFYLLYRRTSSILNSVQATATIIHDISSYLGGEVVKPVAQVVAIIQGIRQGVNVVGKCFRKEGGKNG